MTSSTSGVYFNLVIGGSSISDSYLFISNASYFIQNLLLITDHSHIKVFIGKELQESFNFFLSKESNVYYTYFNVSGFVPLDDKLKGILSEYSVIDPKNVSFFSPPNETDITYFIFFDHDTEIGFQQNTISYTTLLESLRNLKSKHISFYNISSHGGAFLRFCKLIFNFEKISASTFPTNEDRQTAFLFFLFAHKIASHSNIIDVEGTIEIMQSCEALKSIPFETLLQKQPQIHFISQILQNATEITDTTEITKELILKGKNKALLLSLSGYKINKFLDDIKELKDLGMTHPIDIHTADFFISYVYNCKNLTPNYIRLLFDSNFQNGLKAISTEQVQKLLTMFPSLSQFFQDYFPDFDFQDKEIAFTSFIHQNGHLYLSQKYIIPLHYEYLGENFLFVPIGSPQISILAKLLFFSGYSSFSKNDLLTFVYTEMQYDTSLPFVAKMIKNYDSNCPSLGISFQISTKYMISSPYSHAGITQPPNAHALLQSKIQSFSQNVSQIPCKFKSRCFTLAGTDISNDINNGYYLDAQICIMFWSSFQYFLRFYNLEAINFEENRHKSRFCQQIIVTALNDCDNFFPLSTNPFIKSVLGFVSYYLQNRMSKAPQIIACLFLAAQELLNANKQIPLVDLSSKQNIDPKFTFPPETYLLPN